MKELPIWAGSRPIGSVDQRRDSSDISPYIPSQAGKKGENIPVRQLAESVDVYNQHDSARLRDNTCDLADEISNVVGDEVEIKIAHKARFHERFGISVLAEKT